MRIALVSPVMGVVPPEKYGGIELIVAELARGLAERGHAVTVFCAGGSTIAGHRITRVETSPYPTREYLHENREWEIRQLHEVLDRQHEFDSINLHYEPAACRFGIDGARANILDGFEVPLVLTFHNSTDIAEHKAYYESSPSLGRHTMVFVSDSQRRPLSFFPDTQVIHNAIPVQDFPFEEKKDGYLLFLGRITPDKGIREAIEVARMTGMTLRIVAKVDPTDQEYYETEIKPRIDGDLIRYEGEADFSRKVRYLKKARCLLFPIRWEEPFGLVMIEALACGTPVIAFKRGSVPEIIQHGLNGYVVDTIEEMAEAVRGAVMISPSACRQSVESRFEIDRIIDEYERVFNRVKVS